MKGGTGSIIQSAAGFSPREVSIGDFVNCSSVFELVTSL
ncbi:MAG: hypothetical protein HJJLKODD_02735 [Phycisphaerae bacterium]|nr:hypothetical protein [Phycisphaerae bacterium]